MLAEMWCRSIDRLLDYQVLLAFVDFVENDDKTNVGWRWRRQTF